MNLFAPLPPETRRLMEGIPSLIDKTFPLPARFRSNLPADIAELSRLLTSGRGERGLTYLGRPNLLSAYLRYYLPWNLYRLCRLIPGLGITIAADDSIKDLGCGPLTFAAALWISRPDLRTAALEFFCVDRSRTVLEAGRKFFISFTSGNSPWKIHTIKGDINTIKTKPVTLTCAINVFNEMYGDISRCTPESLKRMAKKSARLLASGGSRAVLVVEPGFPRCGEFISLLRAGLIECGHSPAAPCPHDNACPLPGGMSKKERWCHFAFDTNDAPSALHDLSHAAGIPKERAVLSFLLASPEKYSRKGAEKKKGKSQASPQPSRLCASARVNTEEFLRVVSDAFALPENKYGRYCCSQQGLVLLTGEKNVIEKTHSGALVNADIKKERDSKSGALIADRFKMI